MIYFRTVLSSGVLFSPVMHRSTSLFTSTRALSPSQQCRITETIRRVLGSNFSSSTMPSKLKVTLIPQNTKEKIDPGLQDYIDSGAPKAIGLTTMREIKEAYAHYRRSLKFQSHLEGDPVTAY